ncbi:ephrin type-A receptor 3-like [Arapaima gigas]
MTAPRSRWILLPRAPSPSPSLRSRDAVKFAHGDAGARGGLKMPHHWMCPSFLVLLALAPNLALRNYPDNEGMETPSRHPPVFTQLSARALRCA